MPAAANEHIVTPAEANDIITDRNPVVLDVRTPAEYAEGHINGAVNVPLDMLNESVLADVIPDVDTYIVVYCRSGVRSARACSMLAEMGYGNAYDVSGGIEAWPFGVVREAS